MKWLILASLTCSVGLIGGCASVSVHPVSVADANNPAVSGIRFYQSTPYLLVTEMPTPMHVLIKRNGPGMPPAGPGMAMRGRMEHQHWGHGGNRAEHHHRDGRRMMPKWRGGPTMIHRRPMPAMPMAMARPQHVMMLQIIYLPDFSKPYVANFNNPFSRGKNSIVLANGWELMGINVKGHIKEPPPIRAITASPAHPPRAMHPMMMGPMGMRRGGMGPMGMMPGHPPFNHMKRKGRHGPMIMRGMMPRPGMRFMRRRGMMMPWRAAMAMGLKPGLYQFVYSPKTGQLLGLRAVRILPGMMPFGPRMPFHPMWNHRWHGKHPMKWKKHPMAKPNTTAPATNK